MPTLTNTERYAIWLAERSSLRMSMIIREIEERELERLLLKAKEEQ